MMKKKLQAACIVLLISILVFSGIAMDRAANAAMKRHPQTADADVSDEKNNAGGMILDEGAETIGATEDSTEEAGIPGRLLKQVQGVAISNRTESGALALTWEAAEGASAYGIMRRSDGMDHFEVIAEVGAGQTGYTDRGLTGGDIYSYMVFAQGADKGQGPCSETVSQMAIEKDKKMIALTYDDGPSIYTPTVLEAVEKYGAHVTFFVVGNRIEQYQDYIRQEIALGCEIGSHTFEHTILTKVDAQKIRTTLDQTNEALMDIAGIPIEIMRPPGGAVNQTLTDNVGMPMIIWSLDTVDWKTRDTQATIGCVKEKAFDGAIVLMHDIHEPTVNAADEVIGYLKAEGYQLVTVSELAAYRGGMTAGESYYKFTGKEDGED